MPPTHIWYWTLFVLKKRNCVNIFRYWQDGLLTSGELRAGGGAVVASSHSRSSVITTFARYPPQNPMICLQKTFNWWFVYLQYMTSWMEYFTTSLFHI